MKEFVTTAISGVTFGTLYAVMGVGLVLVYRGSRVINFAYGASIGLLAYIAYELIGVFHNAAIGIALTVGVAVVMGYALRWMVVGAQDHMTHQPMRIRGMFNDDTLLRMVVATIGVSTVIEGVEQIIWGTATLALPVNIGSSVFHVYGIRVAYETPVIIGVGIAVLVVLSLYLYQSRHGFFVRAVFDNPMAANVMGVPVSRSFTAVWVAASVVGLCAAVLGSSVEYISTTSYVSFAFVSFIAVVLGGMDSLFGAIVGGMIVGVFGAFIDTYWTSEAENILLLVLAIGVLSFRPQGLFTSNTEAVSRL